MGSYLQAPIMGFICQICSDINRNVLHLYGDTARKLQLVEKMEKYMSIEVREFDLLPKTICRRCVEVVLYAEKHYLREAMLKKGTTQQSRDEPLDLSLRSSQRAMSVTPPPPRMPPQVSSPGGQEE